MGPRILSVYFGLGPRILSVYFGLDALPPAVVALCGPDAVGQDGIPVVVSHQPVVEGDVRND